MGNLVREGDPKTKIIFEDLLAGNQFTTSIDEQIIFSQLGKRRDAIWSLLLASGYLKVSGVVDNLRDRRKPTYTLSSFRRGLSRQSF